MSANLTAEDIEYLREGYRLFREHDPAYMDRFSPDATFVFPTTFAHVFTWSGEGPLAGRKATSFELICDTASFAAALAGAEPG
jgi:hypothetical protein